MNNSQSIGTSHTPGPWAYTTQTDVPREVRLKREHWEVGSVSTNKGLAIVFQDEANARLIAAAPDLLALAKKLASECAECRGRGYTFSDDGIVGFGPDDREPTREACTECADIREVIAKAEGRS